MSRENALRTWVESVLKSSSFQCLPIAGDASFRRYYRVIDQKTSYIVMDAPPPEIPEQFVSVAHSLKQAGLLVPTIIASDFKEGFLLLTDFGDKLYLNELNEHSADTLYKRAMMALLKIQKCRLPLPDFSRTFLRNQMYLFEEWYLKKQPLVRELAVIQAQLEPIYEQLFQTIELQPQVFVHRDFHSRNLMILENEEPGILDFQDAMIGPITYDLVSLLQDCYITWPRDKVEQWVFDFQSQCVAQGMLTVSISAKEFLRWFDWTGLHRHLKNLGIFSRLHYRDQKSQYLGDIPRVLRYVLETASRYPALAPLKDLLRATQGEPICEP